MNSCLLQKAKVTLVDLRPWQAAYWALIEGVETPLIYMSWLISHLTWDMWNIYSKWVSMISLIIIVVINNEIFGICVPMDKSC